MVILDLIIILGLGTMWIEKCVGLGTMWLEKCAGLGTMWLETFCPSVGQ